MVGLQRTCRHDGISALGKGLPNKELELAGFITAPSKARHIIPFDVEARTMPHLRSDGIFKLREWMERRGTEKERVARKVGKRRCECHGVSSNQIR